MEIFYTKIYNYIGDNANKQEIIAKTADKMGMREFSLFRYSDSCDTDEELFFRMEGVYASFTNEAAILFQYPSMVSARYDKQLAKHLRRYYNSKLIVFFENWGYEVDSEKYPNISDEMEILNSADLLIVDDHNKYNKMVEMGLKETTPVIFLDFWDFPKGLYFENIGNTDVPYVFLQENEAYKAGYYISNHIPIIVPKTSSIAPFVEKYHIGYVCEQNEITDDVITILDNEDTKFAIKAVKDLANSGYFTYEALSKAIRSVVLNTIK